MKTHASGVLGFSFLYGRRPHAKLNPRTPLARVFLGTQTLKNVLVDKLIDRRIN